VAVNVIILTTTKHKNTIISKTFVMSKSHTKPLAISHTKLHPPIHLNQ
jgi:hypothetical protein